MSSSPTAALLRVDFKRGPLKAPKYIREEGEHGTIFDEGRRWQARWHFGGPQRKRFCKEKHSLAQVEDFLRGKLREKASGKTISNNLTPADIQAYIRFIERLEKHRQLTGETRHVEATLDELCACSELAHANKMDLRGAVTLAAQHNPHNYANRTTAEVVTEFLDHIHQLARAQRSSAHHGKMLTFRLAKFSGTFTGTFATLSVPAIDAWLKALNLAPKTWNHYRDSITQLTRWALGKRYCRAELLEEMKRLHRFKKVKSRAPNPYSPAELRAIMEHAQTECDWFVPYLVYVAFCGARSEEAMRADWGEVNFERQEIFLPGDKSKVGLDRFLHFPDNALAWLKLHAKPSGAICPIRKPDQKLRKIRATLKQSAHENGLRSAFLNHRLAVTSDIVKVSDEGGTSPAKIRTNYQKRPSERIGRAYFQIVPDTKQLRLI
jgi:integrase